MQFIKKRKFIFI